MNCSVVTRMRSLLPYAVHCIMTTTFNRGISMMLTTILWPGETILIVICFMTVSATTSRSSHRRCSVRNCVLRNFVKFTGKYLCQSLSFNKVAGLTQAYNFIKILRLWHSYFPVNFTKFQTTPLLQNISGWLLNCTLSELVFVFDSYIFSINKWREKEIERKSTSMKRLMNTDKISILLRERIKDRKTTFWFN